MPVKSAKSTPAHQPDPWQAAWPAITLFLLVLVAYLPALRGQFIWDDDFHVTKAALRSLNGLWKIWLVPGATQQYYPLTHSSFWIDYQLWGDNPLPYHLENIFLHAINAILVWRILRRLEVNGAWLAAALFAVHPVCVESVAWISERKNTLSGLFFLLSLFAAIEFWLPRPAAASSKGNDEREASGIRFGSAKFYWLALALYLCALWCKTAIAGLPGVILLLVWWKLRRVHWKAGALVVPFLALGLAIGLLTASIEHHFILDAGNVDEWKLSLGQKFIIAGRAFWFYLGKLCWPHPLVFFYPRWVIQPSQPLQCLPLVAAIALFSVLWWKRETWGRPVLMASGYFVVMLFPALGFINIFPFRYSFVADHFQYLATLGPLTLTAAGLSSYLSRLPDKEFILKPVAGTVLAALAVLTWLQTGVYRNLETLWRDTIAHNPVAWMAHDNLGRCLVAANRFDEAEAEYRKAIAIRPNDHIAYFDLGLEYAIEGKLDEAVESYSKTLELCPTFGMAHYEIANVRMRQSNPDEAIPEYQAAIKSLPELAVAHFNLANAFAQSGRTDEAIAEYNRTLAAQPDYAPAHVSLGGVLAHGGKLDDAISQFRAALALQPNSVEALANLGNALVSKGELDQAVTTYRQALQLAPNNPTIHFNLSVALQREGNSSEAETERQQASRLRNQRAIAQ